MKNEKLRIIYEDDNLLAVDKPAGIVIFPKTKTAEKTLIDVILKKFPDLKNIGHRPRYGIIHRLDKDTSGIVLAAKNNPALEFFQKEFKLRRVVKKYLALAVGQLKTDAGRIETLLGRAPGNRIKQKVYLLNEPSSKGKRDAVTEYKTLKKFENYTLLEVVPKTGRKHQIRVHLSYLSHPIAGDKLYGFKNQLCPKGLERQFLHAECLKIRLPNGEEKEFKSELAEDLKKIIEQLK